LALVITDVAAVRHVAASDHCRELGKIAAYERFQLASQISEGSGLKSTMSRSGERIVMVRALDDRSECRCWNRCQVGALRRSFPCVVRDQPVKV